jgi:regulatory protein
MATEPGEPVRVARLDELAPQEKSAARVAGFDEVEGLAEHESVAAFGELGGQAGDDGDTRVATGLTGLAGGTVPTAPTAQAADLGRLDAGGRGRTRQRGRRPDPPDAEARGGGARRAGRERVRQGDAPPARDGVGVESLRDDGSERPAITRPRTTGRRGAPDEIDPDADPAAVAREICLRLLTDRSRTRQELAQALRRKGVPDDAAAAVLERFDEVGLIDDAAFAGQWVRSRHAHRGLARRAIAVELRRKGVADDVAGEALAEVDAESEEQRARELVDRKLRSLAVATAEQRAAAGRRLVGMLARKGYGAGVAYRVVREALAERGADMEELGEG